MAPGKGPNSRTTRTGARLTHPGPKKRCRPPALSRSPTLPLRQNAGRSPIVRSKRSLRTSPQKSAGEMPSRESAAVSSK